MYNTEKEIRDELNSISKCLQLVCGKEDEILRTFSGARRMWFIGSGSSFCLAKSAAAMFTMRCDIPSLAVAAGDLLLHTERYLNAVKGSVVVFVSRSGMTSEVLRVYDLVAKLEGVSTVSLCANVASTLNDACDLSLCVPWAFDESVCQTRTIGSFFAALAMICALVSRDTRLQEQLKAASRMGGALDERVLPLARQLAEKDWDHVVVLADAEAAGVMEEGALAFKEICCLNSNFYNLLDVRHGPVVMIDERTFVFAFLESAGQTEQALLEDLRKRTGYVVSLGPFAAAEGEDTHFDTGEITDPVAAAIPALYLLQNVALYKALKRGVDPDRPNGLSAWIRL